MTYVVGFKNLTGMDLDFLDFGVWYGAFDAGRFDPNGIAVGASVDNVASEYAAFQSSLAGIDLGYPFGEYFTCDTRIDDSLSSDGDFYYALTGPAAECGSFLPDENYASLGFDDVGNNEIVTTSFTLTMTLEASSVPEPSPLTVFGGTLLGWYSLRRKKARHKLQDGI